MKILFVEYKVFFISNVFFFKSASVLQNFFTNATSNVAELLLVVYNHHHTKTHFIYSMYVTMCWPGSIYAVSMSSIFHYHPHFYHNQYIISLNKTHLYFAHFLEHLKLVYDMIWYDIDKESELFSNSKSSGCVHPFLLKPFPLVETFIWCETWRPLK